MKKSMFLPLSFTIFALFFGAGNLLFPPMLGAMAGENLVPALAGFIITGVGLPLLTLFAVARVGGGTDQIARHIPKKAAVLLTALMYIAIGPFFGIPRTAIVTYEMGVTPFLGEPSLMTLAFSSFIFFGLALILSLRAQKLIEVIGRVITPVLLGLLAIIGIANWVAPLGSKVAPQAGYETWSSALAEGFKQGYLTMDVFGALVFGAIVLVTLRASGVTDKREASSLLKSAGVLAATCLMLVYMALGSIGANMTSTTGSVDGADLLQAFAKGSFGMLGMGALGVAIFLACLTTAIGLITEFSRFISQAVPRLKYAHVVFGTTFFGFVVSLVGLDTLINIALPLLTFLYPVMIMLVVISITEKFQGNKRLVMGVTLVVTVFFSVAEMLQSLYPSVVTEWVSLLPLASIGLAWSIPSFVVYALTLVSSRRSVSTETVPEEKAS